MKKHVLFIINNMHCGGAEKALLSLLQTIDYSRYKVDLFLFRHEGMFLRGIPDQVTLLEEPVAYRYFDMPIAKAVLLGLKRGDARAAFARARAGLIYKIEKNRIRCEQRVWKHIARSLPDAGKAYDIAVGYLEKNPVYYCVDKVKAARKIGFIHNDYEKLGLQPEFDLPFFKRLDHLVTVSEECAHILKRRFPGLEHKVKVMHNIVSPAMIRRLAKEQELLTGKGIRIVSVGRLNAQKGFDLAIEACFLLVRSGVELTWFVIGEGEEREALTQKVEAYGLQDRFRLLGLKENPYPYVRAADLYVQPSRFEGKSIAVDEAKILHKPIVLTRFSTAKDQIAHQVNGLIVDMDPVSLAAGIKGLIERPEERKRLAAALAKESLGTESEIETLYGLFEQPAVGKEGIG